MSPIVRLENFQQFAAINVLSDPGHQGGPIVIPSCVQLTIAWVLTNAKIGVNVMYGTVAAGFTPTTAICDAIKTALSSGAAWTALAVYFNTANGMQSVRLRDVRTANNPVVSSNTTPVLGAAAGPPMPSEVAVVVTLRTAKTGASNRGRIYIPGWASGSQGTADTLTPAAVTALQTWASGIPAILTTNGLTLALGQPARAAYVGSTGTSHPARIAQSTPVTALVVRNNTWDSQRRRGLK
jgi:hypothetical protein